MNAKEWRRRIKRLPPRLTQSQAAKMLGQTHGATRLWLIRLNYPFIDGRRVAWDEKRRKNGRKLDPNSVDWSQRNVDIAKQRKVSRERVRQIRDLLKIRKVLNKNTKGGETNEKR